MNFQQLEHALVLARTGSFSKAAKVAGLTQSAISQQITKLEAELGFLLFDRQTKPVTPTPNGARFLQRAQLVMLEAQQLKEFALQIEEDEEGILEIGIIPTLAPYLVPMFINTLHEKYPGIKLTIREMMTRDIVQAIISRQLDAGIISTPIQSSLEFVQIPLFFEKFFLYVSYKHHLYTKRQITLDSITADDLWLLNEGNCFSDQVTNMCHLESTIPHLPNLRYHSNSIESLRRIVEYRGGITFLPELATLNVQPNQEDMIKKLAGTPRAREISLLYLPNDPKQGKLHHLSQVIKASLPVALLRKEDKILVKTNVSV